MSCKRPIQTVTKSGTTIISPNHPFQYKNNRDCQLKIWFHEGQKVSIRFDHFDLQLHPDLSRLPIECPDWLEIRDGHGLNSTLIQPKMCGENIPGKIVSIGRSMTLNFHSDNSVTKTGFTIIADAYGMKYRNDYVRNI